MAVGIGVGIGIGIVIEWPLRFVDARKQGFLIDADTDTDIDPDKSFVFVARHVRVSTVSHEGTKPRRIEGR